MEGQAQHRIVGIGRNTTSRSLGRVNGMFLYEFINTCRGMGTGRDFGTRGQAIDGGGTRVDLTHQLGKCPEPVQRVLGARGGCGAGVEYHREDGERASVVPGGRNGPMDT